MSYKEIDLQKALETIMEEGSVYALFKLDKDATIADLYGAEAFMVQNRVEPKLQKEKQIWPPKKEPARVDHDKICALYKAKWTIAKIADEMGCSEQTIRNHLDKEGLRK